MQSAWNPVIDQGSSVHSILSMLLGNMTLVGIRCAKMIGVWTWYFLITDGLLWDVLISNSKIICRVLSPGVKSLEVLHLNRLKRLHRVLPMPINGLPHCTLLLETVGV